MADAPDSKSGSRKRVGVRPSLWAPMKSSLKAAVDSFLVCPVQAQTVSINIAGARMNWAVERATTLYSGCHGRKPLDMIWGLAYSSPEFAMEYL